MTPSSSFRTLTRGGASIALIAAGALFLAGCSSNDAETSAASSAPSAASDPQMQAPSGVSGLIASLSDGTMQVQGADEQNAVSYSDSTTVSETVSGDVSSVVVGSCVLVTGTADGDEADSVVTAESITVSEAVDGECTGGFGGGMPTGDLPTGEDGEMPAPPSGAPADGEMPSGAPSGAPSGGGMGGGFVVGLVSAVDGDTVTVESSMADESTTRSVATTDDTSVTTTVASDVSALEVGRCVVVQGDADDAGTVEATALTVSDAVDGECTTGMPGGFGGRPGSESTDD